jgi:hypothetical protein
MPVIEDYRWDNMSWRENSIYFYYPYAFVSPFVTKFHKNRSAFPGAKLIIADSGGFQLKVGTRKEANWYEILQFQEGIADINFTLDIPPISLSGNNRFQKALELSVYLANNMMREKTKDAMKTFGVLHGDTFAQLQYWYNIMTYYYSYPGFAIPMIHIRGKKDVDIYCEQLKFVKSLGTDLHFLGNRSQLDMLVFSRLAYLSKKNITFDSSTASASLLYGHYIDPYLHKCLNFTKKEDGRIQLDGKDYTGCWCPICKRHLVEELFYKPELIMLHNIFIFKSYANYASRMVQDDKLFRDLLYDILHIHPIARQKTVKDKPKYLDDIVKRISNIL